MPLCDGRCGAARCQAGGACRAGRACAGLGVPDCASVTALRCGARAVCRRNLWLATTLVLIAGCAGAPVVPEAADFRVLGKIGVVEGARAFSARFNWAQTGARYDIALWGPLGQGSTRLRGDSEQVEIVGKGGRPVLTGHPETVMRRRLGWSLPLAVLPWWMSGQPAPEVTSRSPRGTGRGACAPSNSLVGRFAMTASTGAQSQPCRAASARQGRDTGFG